MIALDFFAARLQDSPLLVGSVFLDGIFPSRRNGRDPGFFGALIHVN